MTITLKRSHFTAILVAIILLGGYSAYRSRLRIEAKFWHWRNGNELTWTHYQVPVPDQWLVADAREDIDATLIDTRAYRRPDQLVRFNTLLTVFTPGYHGDLDKWKSRYEQLLKDQGMRDVHDSALQTKDEIVSCVGVHVPNPLISSPTTIVAMQCMSPGGLFLTFTGNEAGLREFYTIISQIRKRV